MGDGGESILVVGDDVGGRTRGGGGMSNGGEFRRAGGRKGVGGCVGWGRERVMGRLRGSVGWVGDSGPRDVFRSVDAVGGDGGAIGVACRGGVRGGGWLWEVGLGREGEKSGKGGYSGSKSGDKGGGKSETEIGEKGIVGGAVGGWRGESVKAGRGRCAEGAGGGEKGTGGARGNWNEGAGGVVGAVLDKMVEGESVVGNRVGGVGGGGMPGGVRADGNGRG